MELEQALKRIGFLKYDLCPSEDDCEYCSKKYKQLYYRENANEDTLYCWLCAECVKKFAGDTSENKEKWFYDFKSSLAELGLDESFVEMEVNAVDFDQNISPIDLAKDRYLALCAEC